MTKEFLVSELIRRINLRVDYYRPLALRVDKFGIPYEHYVGRIEGLQEVLSMLKDYD